MKIVHELQQLDYGGVERVIANIIKFDKENEHTVLAYKDGPFKAELIKAGAKVILSSENEGQDFEGDLIHIHTGGGDSPLARDLGQAFPVVETIHSPVRSRLPQNLITQRVGVTDVVSDMNNNCTTIHNGLDFEALYPSKSKEEIFEELKINPNIPVVGRLGRIGPDKGLEAWLLTVHKLQVAGLEFTPVIVGGEATYSPGYIGRVKLIAASLPVKNLIWVGHESEVSNYLQIMDVFLYPSPTEGFGLVLIEAIFNECRVVTYGNNVNMEIIGGYAVLTSDKIADLAHGVIKALGSDLADELVSIGPDFVKQQYNVETMVAKYQELYERCNKNFKW